MKKIVSNKFYTETDDLVFYKHENYKSYLSIKKKTAKQEVERLNNSIKRQRDRIALLQSELNEALDARKLYKKDIKAVDTEYSYRKKIAALLKKYTFLDVLWYGDEDVYTTWVYSDDFDGDKDWEGDPYADQHYKDSYAEAFDACIEYIDLHEKKEVA